MHVSYLRAETYRPISEWTVPEGSPWTGPCSWLLNTRNCQRYNGHNKGLPFESAQNIYADVDEYGRTCLPGGPVAAAAATEGEQAVFFVDLLAFTPAHLHHA